MVHGVILNVTRLYETAYVSDVSSIQIIVKCGRTFQGPLAPIPLQGIHGGLPGILSTSAFQYRYSVQFNDEVISRTRIVRILKMLCLMNFL